MRFTQTLLAALSVAVSQAVILTNSDYSQIAAGTPFVITFAEATGPVTVYLATGTPQNVIQGPAIGSASGATGSITWTPTSGGSFALQIVDAGAAQGPTNPNYSGFFNVAGPVVGTTTSTTASMMSSASTSLMTSSTTSGSIVSTTSTPSSVIVSTTTPLTSTTMVVPVTNSTTLIYSTTGYSNSTTASGSQSATTAPLTPTQIPTSKAASFASPLAFVLLALGALVTLN